MRTRGLSRPSFSDGGLCLSPQVFGVYWRVTPSVHRVWEDIGFHVAIAKKHIFGALADRPVPGGRCAAARAVARPVPIPLNHLRGRFPRYLAELDRVGINDRDVIARNVLNPITVVPLAESLLMTDTNVPFGQLRIKNSTLSSWRWLNRDSVICGLGAAREMASPLYLPRFVPGTRGPIQPQ